MFAQTVVLAVLVASPPPEPAPPEPAPVDPVTHVEPWGQPEPTVERKGPRSTKGVALITIGGVCLAGGVGSLVSAGVIALSNPFETQPESVALIIAGNALLASGLPMLVIGAIRNTKGNIEARTNASARRWTPTFAFAQSGGQVGLRLQF